MEATFTDTTNIALIIDGVSQNLTATELAFKLSNIDCDGATCSSSLASTGALDIFFLLFAAVLVFLMQAGFTFLEVGSVHMKNTKNILTKNLGDACIGAMAFYVLGYGFALVDGNDFIGDAGFVLHGAHFQDASDGKLYNGYNYAFWVFQWAFAATAATIVSGAVAERVTFIAYFSYSFFLTIFVYPVVVHWGWSSTGWASAFKGEDLLFDLGAIDFAGSGVVHMTGGLAALIGCFLLGPRTGRFDGNGTPIAMPQQSVPMQTLGTMILWFGWYGFNCGSTLTLAGNASDVAAKTAVTTTLSAAVSGICTVIWGKLFLKKGICPSLGNNGILAGLVGITAGCSTVDPEGAIIIGFVSSIVYISSSRLLIRLQIDDVVDCIPVHFFCGMWGVVAAGLFATAENYSMAYGGNSCGLFYKCDGNSGRQFAANIVFILAIIAWVGSMSFIMFSTLKYFDVLRVSASVEEEGLDISEHGGHCYIKTHSTLQVAGQFLQTQDINFEAHSTPTAATAGSL